MLPVEHNVLGPSSTRTAVHFNAQMLSRRKVLLEDGEFASGGSD